MLLLRRLHSEGLAKSKVTPVCCIQVCRDEADVKRALQAWSQYRVSGKQPAELYEASQPKKRTLASMWGLCAASEGSRKQSKLMTGSPACNAQHGHNCAAQTRTSLQGASSSVFQATKEVGVSPEDLLPARLKAAEHPASCQMASATAVNHMSANACESALDKGGACKLAAQATKGLDAQTAETDVELMDSQHASAPNRLIMAGRSQSFGIGGQERAASSTEPCKGSSSHSVQCMTTSSRVIIQSGHEKGAAPANALSVLMETGKSKHIGAASPQSEKKVRPKASAPQAFQQSSWKDALRQVALDPERCVCLHYLARCPTNI